VAYLQTRRTSAVMYIGQCSVPRFEGRFSYSDVLVMSSLGTENEFVYSREERWCYLGNTGRANTKDDRRYVLWELSFLSG
jgi:hypothetical protein